MFVYVRRMLITGALIALTACGSGGTATGPISPTPAPEGTVVTIKVAGAEEYKLLLTDPEDIAVARQLLAGEEAPTIPNGRVVRGEPGINDGWSWHIDPASVEFVDMTMEVCDGRPSDVEQEIITSEYFCPWSAEVIAIEG
jgi:hypothetical protein